MADASLQETLDSLHRKRSSHEGFLKIIQWVLGIVVVGLFAMMLWLDDYLWALFLLVLLGLLGATIETTIHLSRTSRKEMKAVLDYLNGSEQTVEDVPSTRPY